MAKIRHWIDSKNNIKTNKSNYSTHWRMPVGFLLDLADILWSLVPSLCLIFFRVFNYKHLRTFYYSYDTMRGGGTECWKFESMSDFHCLIIDENAMIKLLKFGRVSWCMLLSPTPWRQMHPDLYEIKARQDYITSSWLVITIGRPFQK